MMNLDELEEINFTPVDELREESIREATAEREMDAYVAELRLREHPETRTHREVCRGCLQDHTSNLKWWILRAIRNETGNLTVPF